MTLTTTGKPTSQSVGADLPRFDAIPKVTGAATYSFEYRVGEAAYVWPVQATVARGRVLRVDPTAALALPGVLAVLDATNAPRLHTADDPTLAVMQRPQVSYRGEIVAAVIATSIETAREAASAVHTEYEKQDHHVVLREDDPGIYAPESVNAGFPGTLVEGDVEAALAAAPVKVDRRYTTPGEHPSAMEPHATIASWSGGALTLYESSQGPSEFARVLAPLFGVPEDSVSVISEYVGGGFGSKGLPHPSTVLAAMAARVVDRPVKIALTRQQMFSLVPYRTPTVQRVRLGAQRDGRLVAIDHDALHQSSTLVEFTEQTVTPTRVMYASPNLRTVHRLARLDVPPPHWMRGPGEVPGMFALESAMDELAVELEMDPIEVRIANDTAVEPESGLPFTSRNLVACLREGARRFDWEHRDPRPGSMREGRWLVGLGVASATYPYYLAPSTASVRAEPDGSFVVRIAAVDIGTGARTSLLQIAADALGVGRERVIVELGHSRLPSAPFAGGSWGTASWGWAITKACRALLSELELRAGGVPAEGIETLADTTNDVQALSKAARHAFGAQFARVQVDIDSGSVRVDRLLGVYAGGRIINPRLARSQVLGAMVMGISSALHESLEMDPQFGDFANHDLATYHFAANADVRDVEAVFLEEDDPNLNPMGSKGLGELGIVGTAAAVANAVYHATGTRVRDLPITLERVRAGFPARSS
ncbi:xanthine dehydrogenase family protein molybdopterin-binding subunit [Pseudonocardia xinjiangensis]|uniref:xanthine dehydrogenase family protein molybdopterin-binding subunit n=1 Tax=Pseudonocardia xinjiangensis TaxID=75289 RepID=UPI003D932B51